MSKFTPGPWEYTTHPKAEECSIFSRDWGPIAKTQGDSYGLEEKEPNARLMSLAPTMYEALKNIINLPDNIACPSVKNFAKEAIKNV